MIHLPEATRRIAADLTTAAKGRRAASRLGDSLGSRLLRNAREPLDPHNIAALEEIEVVRASALGESGRIEWTSGGLRVVLRETDGLQRQRFTLAHELGHHLIFGIGKEPKRNYSREEETRCDRFAAALLMPKKAFTSAYNRQQSCSRAAAIRTLSDRFDVSLRATMIRLTNLGIVDSGAILLLLERDPRGDYRVAAAWYDKSVYRRIEGMTTEDLGIEQKRAVAMSAGPGTSRVGVSAWLPTKLQGLPSNAYSIVPAEMTCVPLRRDSQQILIDVEVVVDPLRPRFRKHPSSLQAELFG